MVAQAGAVTGPTDEGLSINPASGGQAHVGLNMLRQSLEGAPELPEGLGRRRMRRWCLRSSPNCWPAALAGLP